MIEMKRKLLVAGWAVLGALTAAHPALAARAADAAQAAQDPSVQALAAVKALVEQCQELPTDHPYGCRQLVSLDLIKACSQFPADHPQGCRRLLSMDLIKACGEFPPDHDKGCRKLLSFVPKCPPGTVPGLNCRHMLVQERPGPVVVANLETVKAAEVSSIFAGSPVRQ